MHIYHFRHLLQCLLNGHQIDKHHKYPVYIIYSISINTSNYSILIQNIILDLYAIIIIVPQINMLEYIDVFTVSRGTFFAVLPRFRPQSRRKLIDA